MINWSNTTSDLIDLQFVYIWQDLRWTYKDYIYFKTVPDYYLFGCLLLLIRKLSFPSADLCLLGWPSNSHNSLLWFSSKSSFFALFSSLVLVLCPPDSCSENTYITWVGVSRAFFKTIPVHWTRVVGLVMQPQAESTNDRSLFFYFQFQTLRNGQF